MELRCRVDLNGAFFSLWVFQIKMYGGDTYIERLQDTVDRAHGGFGNME